MIITEAQNTLNFKETITVDSFSSISYSLSQKDLRNIQEGKEKLNEFPDALFIAYNFEGELTLHGRTSSFVSYIQVWVTRVILFIETNNGSKIEVFLTK